MMRLPARLLAKLAKARIAQILKPAAAHSFLEYVDAAEILHPGSSAPVSHEKMQSVQQSPAPVIWISGSEPLLHPGIAHFARAIAQSDHYVFLETSGTLLRRRIHEFQPLPQIFFVVRLDARRGPDFDLAAEGLRAARLSGFFTVVRTVVGEDSDFAELARLRSFLEELDIDGWLVTAASSNAAEPARAAEARGLIPGMFWRQFSALVEEALQSHARGTELSDAPASITESLRTESREEGVKVG